MTNDQILMTKEKLNFRMESPPSRAHDNGERKVAQLEGFVRQARHPTGPAGAPVLRSGGRHAAAVEFEEFQ